VIHLLWASLAIPIVIHLVYRRRAKRIPFSTLYFLRMIDQRVARRQRLKELLLLMVRLLLLAALIGALEKPMLRSAAFTGANVPTTAVVVLDNTYSMRAASTGSTAFHRAKRAAIEVLDGLKSEDSASVILFDSPEDVPPTPTTDIAGLRARLDEMQCGFGTAQLAGPLERALKSLEAGTNPRREIYIITDMQKLCWTGALKDLSDRFPEDVPVLLMSVGAPVEDNLTLSDVNFALKVNVVGSPSTLFCDVANRGSRGVQRKLSFHLEGKKLAARSIALAPHSNVSAAFAHTFRKTGKFKGYVELEPDGLAADNRRYFTVRVHEKVPVLVVDGSPSIIPYRDEVFYLKLALQVQGEPGRGLSPISVEVVRPGEFLQQQLAKYACVILANVARLDERWSERLRDYVMRGGGLIIFCGPQVDPASYNAALGAQEGESESLLPAQLQNVKRADEGEGGFPRVERVDRQHPVFRDIIDEIELGTTQVRAFFSVAEMPQSNGAGVLAALREGPLLLEKKAGAGTVMLCTSTCNPEWNNMPLKPFFLPLVHQMVYYVSRAGSRETTTLVGLAYTLDIPGVKEPVQVRFYDPSKESEAEPDQVLTSEVAAGKNTVVFHGTRQPGFYRAEYEVGGLTQEHTFAVNVESAEGDLEQVPLDEAAQMLNIKNLRLVAGPDRLAQLVRRERQGLPLWDYLLLATIALAVCESFVANVFLKH